MDVVPLPRRVHEGNKIGRQRNKKSRSRAVILVALRKVLKAVKDLWVSEIDGSFFID